MAKKKTTKKSTVEECVEKMTKLEKELSSSGLKHFTGFLDEATKSMQKHLKGVDFNKVVAEVVDEVKKEYQKAKKEMKK